MSWGQTSELDDARQHRPPELRLLLSPGLSERLVRQSTDEWSSSNPAVSAAFTETLASETKHSCRASTGLNPTPDTGT
jgi:hypothetical protein